MDTNEFTGIDFTKEKLDTKARQQQAKLEADSAYATAMDSLEKESKANFRKLKDSHRQTLLTLHDHEAIRKENRHYRNNVKDFKYLLKGRKTKIKLQYQHDRHHRPFVSYIDAYCSQPPLWLVNLITSLIFLAAFIVCGVYGGLFSGPGKSFPGMVSGFFKGFFIPDYGLFFGTGSWSFDQSVFFLCLQTFGIAFLGTVFASLLAIPFGFLASHKLMGRWAIISEVLLILIRTFPEILFCMILVQVTGVGPVTGVVVLSFQSVGMIGKMYSDDLDSMNTSFLESLDASGATTLSKIRVGVFPQVFSNFISTVLYRFDLNLRNAAILGIVGAGDMGRLILSYSSDQNWPQLGALLWGLLVMVLIVDAISTAIRKKLV